MAERAHWVARGKPMSRSIMGVIVAMLSITGVYLWLKKRRSKAVAHTRRDKPVSVAPA